MSPDVRLIGGHSSSYSSWLRATFTDVQARKRGCFVYFECTCRPPYACIEVPRTPWKAWESSQGTFLSWCTQRWLPEKTSGRPPPPLADRAWSARSSPGAVPDTGGWFSHAVRRLAIWKSPNLNLSGIWWGRLRVPPIHCTSATYTLHIPFLHVCHQSCLWARFASTNSR